MFQKIHPSGQIYIGKVVKNLKNNNTIVHLLKGYHYDGKEVKQFLSSNVDPTKFMLVIETYGWRYAQKSKVFKLFNLSHESQEELLYDDPKLEGTTISNKYYYRATESPNYNVPLYKLIDSQDLDDFAFLVRQNVEYQNKNELMKELKINVTTDDENIEDNISPKIKKYRKLILNKLEGLELVENREEKKEEAREQEGKKEVTEEMIIEKMNQEPTIPQDILITDQDMINKFVDNAETLDLEANKIKKYLLEIFYLEGPNKENNEEKLYGTLRFIYYNGYLHVFRTEIPLKENITHKLLEDTAETPKLKVLGLAEYGRPIRHNVLKFILFQNELQKNIMIDQELLKEAELVLSQEYIIALTPEPRYQIWCLVRLIKLWFGDIDLQNNIRKIKLLVNQFRARSDKKYNIHNGIRFSIGVYPRYGKKSATIVLKKILYYFSLYSQAVGWKNNPPSYFKIVNDLVSYTNCSQSLKLYYRRIAEMNNESSNIFSKNYTLMNSLYYSGTNSDILEEYVNLI
jgi:hypothetical protein